MSEKLEQMIKAFLEGPEPPPKPPEPELPEANILPFTPWGPSRKWTAEPAGTVNSVHGEPTDIDRLIETQRAVAEAARADRRRRDPFGTGIYGHETLEEILRRQDGHD
jgi:hypothetical protein